MVIKILYEPAKVYFAVMACWLFFIPYITTCDKQHTLSPSIAL